MKLVYICSRYRADATHTVEEAVDSALYACSVAISKGCAPIAPHLYLPRCLDDNEPAERAAGTAAGLAFLAVCDEVWQWGKTITEGMAAELARAKELGIPIKVYNTLGIPYEQWNSVKLANDPAPTLLSARHDAAICLQGSMIGRADRNGPQGNGVNEDVSFTLNTTDRHAVVVENHPQDSRVSIRKDGTVQTLTGQMGTGGGNVPLVLLEE